MPQEFKDFFSTQAARYALFRPDYPPELFAFLREACASHGVAWDCGTGNGQAALALAPFFGKVIATDPSQKQLAEATPHPKVEYRLAAAEASKIEPASVDLVTVAQAFHWFRQPEFFSEVTRVAKPGCLLAIWCYELAEIDPAVDQVVHQLYQGILGPYWDSARKLVEEGYSKCVLPFAEIAAPKMRLKAHWDLAHFYGYLGTWSASQKFVKEKGEDPRARAEAELAAAWGNNGQARKVEWPLALRVFRVQAGPLG